MREMGGLRWRAAVAGFDPRRVHLGQAPKNIEGMRSKLKRLVSSGLAIESEPGLFAPNRR